VLIITDSNGMDEGVVVVLLSTLSLDIGRENVEFSPGRLRSEVTGGVVTRGAEGRSNPVAITVTRISSPMFEECETWSAGDIEQDAASTINGDVQ
jgi:hypothetical protein